MKLNKTKTKVWSIVTLAVTAFVTCPALVANTLKHVFADANDYNLTNATVDLDGENDGTATISFTTTTGGDFYGFSGAFSTAEILP